MNVKHVGLLFLVLASVLSGCSINHPVAKDYPDYLVEHGQVGNLPKTSLESTYGIDEQTEKHRYEFRAASVGYAHLWIVEFGKILEQTLNAPYVQESFGKLEKASATDAGNAIEFTLNSYEFKDYRAYVSMNIAMSKNGKEVLNKNYTSEGSSKGGQMWGAGPFGMKSATLDSTRSAIDKILTQFINDIPQE
ncbi:hypothetical protein [Simiduia agarivorans]|uniref:Lipoprotein n=1 Tax=Simiduia agarivorans (strain DSM 21679 / JCM 13881 / BCRC 17597 / SA1) TaxID=1117647 RepID=K4KMB5_SIMAS|nr:hypothetical protein [Simiduia agarivorans]AFV00320.1 hypothetical protein M5M_15935 [Simiduia agarivorans SA1 = DSM 21679]